MGREWSGNLWLVIELAIITVILWYVGSELYAIYRVYQPDPHYDISRDYVMNVNSLPEESPEYIEYSDRDRQSADFDLLIDQLRNIPAVKAVGRTNNGIPYAYNYFGTQLMYVEDGDTLLYSGNRRSYDGEAIKIMGMTGTRGETPEQIAAELDAGRIILSTIGYEFLNDQNEKVPDLVDVDRLRGKTLTDVYRTDNSYQVSMIQVAPVRRSDFEPTFGRGTILCGIGNRLPSEILISVEPGRENELVEAVNNASLRAGNFYLTSLKPVSQRRDEANYTYNNKIFNTVMQSIFFLVIAFLGVLGTYWFRVQQRVPEIAVRKVNGATNGAILRRLFGESLILCSIAAIIALVLEWLLIDKEIISEFMGYFPRRWLYITMVLSVVMMVIAVLTATYIPARKAMKIDPATALKEQ